MFDLLLSLTSSTGEVYEWYEILITFVGIIAIISVAGFWICFRNYQQRNYDAKKVTRIYMCSKDEYDNYISSLNKKNTKKED